MAGAGRVELPISRVTTERVAIDTTPQLKTIKWLEAESNRRRPTYEIGALPSELSSRDEILSLITASLRATAFSRRVRSRSRAPAVMTGRIFAITITSKARGGNRTRHLSITNRVLRPLSFAGLFHVRLPIAD